MYLDLSAFIPINKLTTMAVFAGGAGVYFFFQGLTLIGRAKALTHARESTVRDAPLGGVAISGMAMGPHTLNAPVSGNPCFVYQTIVWEQNQPGRNQSWKKVADETLHLPFFVQDSTGQVLVEPFNAELDLRPDIQQEFGPASSVIDQDAIPPRVSIFLSRHGVVLGRHIRVEERVIRREMPVFITGTLIQNPGIRIRPFLHETNDSTITATAHVTDAESEKEIRTAATVIKLAGGQAPHSTSEMNQQQKIAAALARAGITKPEAWAAAGVPYQSVDDAEPCPVVAADRVQLIDEITETVSEKPLTSTPETSPDPFPGLVLMKGDEHSIFVISDRSQRELAGAFTWKSIALILGGAFLALLGSYVLLLEHQLR